MHHSIIILDFGSQYTQLIARRVRELNVYCEIHPYCHIPELADHVKGIILSGSPSSVRDTNAPQVDLEKLLTRPTLGVCYGAQYIAQKTGGEVLPSNSREYGRAHLKTFNKDNILLKGLSDNSQVWMSHGDT
ncbi:MAG: glutamine amidotransferase-related protein, partial [Bacteroidia bacterium]